MKFKKSLAKQLLFWILLSSSILTLVITCLHFYVDYRNDISAIDARLNQIETSYIPTIGSALWVEDETQLEVQITGIKNLPEVILVQLSQDGVLRIQRGEKSSEYIREGRWPILQAFDGSQIKLGELYVVTDLLPVYRRLADKALLTLATQGAKTFIISFVIFFIVYSLIARHISHIAQSMANFELKNDKTTPLVLPRPHPQDDELNYLVYEYNKMNHEICETFKEVETQRAKAEEVNRLKSEFLANISHEVKTPMNGVYGMAHLLSNTKMTDEQQEYVNVIIRSSEHMLELLNSILDFSKIEANKLELYEQPFELNELLNEIAQTFYPEAKAKNLAFHHKIDEQIVDRLLGDAARMRQIFVNLLSNAFKFTKTGQVSIQASLVNRDAFYTTQDSKDLTRQQSYRILFSVTDTGKGIAEDKQGLIFDKFTQEDNSTTRGYGGTGLGLAISHHLVKLMGGELQLESEKNKGCRFFFTLSFEALAPRLSNDGQDLESLRNLSALIVDDHEFNTRIMSELLSSWHMNTFAVHDPSEAIFQCQSKDNNNEGYDFILVDKCMPKLNGYSVIKQVLQLGLIKKPKIILTSARADEDDAEKCQTMGIDAFLSLPANQSQIQHLLLSLHNALPIHPQVELHPVELDTDENTEKDEDEQTQKLRETKSTSSPTGLNSPTILLVEDSLINQQICVAILKKFEYKILVANNGAEAIDRWQENDVNLVIMDCHMPVMNGFDATRKIRQLEPDDVNPVPILAVTASDSDLDKQKCFDAGMNAFIAKPFVPKHLIAVINKYISQSDTVISM